MQHDERVNSCVKREDFKIFLRHRKDLIEIDFIPVGWWLVLMRSPLRHADRVASCHVSRQTVREKPRSTQQRRRCTALRLLDAALGDSQRSQQEWKQKIKKSKPTKVK